jgi:hypothetical protein
MVEDLHIIRIYEYLYEGYEMEGNRFVRRRPNNRSHMKIRSQGQLRAILCKLVRDEESSFNGCADIIVIVGQRRVCARQTCPILQ